MALLINPFFLSVQAQEIKCEVEDCVFFHDNFKKYFYELPEMRSSNYLVFNDKDILKIKNVDNNDYSLYVAILGVVISLGLPFLIDHKNKKKSIRDDFWIRQVIYPKYVDKIIEFSISSSLISKDKININDWDLFVDENAKMMNVLKDIRSVFSAMSLKINTSKVDEILYLIEEKYSDIVDHQDQYLANLAKIPPVDVNPPDIDEFLKWFSENSRQISVEIVKAIHDVQK